MSRAVELARLARGTGLASRVDKFVLRVFGKDVVAISAREVERAAVVLSKELQLTAKLIVAGVFAEASRIYPQLLARYPSLLKKIDRGVFAELVQTAAMSKGQSFKSLRGLLVEKLMRTLPEFAELETALNVVLAAANKRGRGWSAVRAVTGVVDGHGLELGDLLMVSVHKDGRVWVMAVLESKSLSNTKELAHRVNEQVGQHLWDFARARSRGLTIEGRSFKPSQVVLEPVPMSRRPGAAVVDAKTMDNRAREMSSGLYTSFIGFVPRDLTQGELRKITAQGIQIETWRWPFEISEFDNFQRDLTQALSGVLP